MQEDSFKSPRKSSFFEFMDPEKQVEVLMDKNKTVTEKHQDLIQRDFLKQNELLQKRLALRNRKLNKSSSTSSIDLIQVILYSAFLSFWCFFVFFWSFCVLRVLLVCKYIVGFEFDLIFV